MDKKGILLAALQETKLSSKDPLSCSSSYNVLRQDREKNKGGGIAFLIHISVTFRPLDIPSNSTDDHLEIQGISVRSGEVDIEIYNLYIPLVVQPFNRISFGGSESNHTWGTQCAQRQQALGVRV